MANYSHTFSTPHALLPVKVQAQKVKNNGRYPIYVCEIEDDIPLAPQSMLAYCKIVILPGQEVDLTIHPYLISNLSSPDRDVTIHSDNQIDITVESYDKCDRWTGDLHHPWSGHALPNGTYTEKYKSMTSTINNAYTSSGWWNISPDPWDETIMYNPTETKTNKCTCGMDSIRAGGKHSTWCDKEDL